MNEIQNHNKCEQVKELLHSVEKHLVLLGKYLLEIRENREYEPMHDNFKEFLYEIGMSEGNATKYIAVYKKLILEYQIPEEQVVDVGVAKAYEITKVATSKKDAISTLEYAQNATVSHLKAQIKEKYQGIDQNACNHEFRTLKICKKCNYKEEEFNN